MAITQDDPGQYYGTRLDYEQAVTLLVRSGYREDQAQDVIERVAVTGRQALSSLDICADFNTGMYVITRQGNQGLTNEEIAAAYLARLRAQREDLRELPQWYFTAKLTAEAAEAQEAWMAWSGWSRHAGSKTHLAEEIADTVISAYALAAVTGIDLQAAIAAKHAILEGRDWTTGSSTEGTGS